MDDIIEEFFDDLRRILNSCCNNQYGSHDWTYVKFTEIIDDTYILTDDTFSYNYKGCENDVGDMCSQCECILREKQGEFRKILLPYVNQLEIQKLKKDITNLNEKMENILNKTT